MSKIAQITLVCLSGAVLVGGGAVWLLRDRIADKPTANSGPRADYASLVAANGGDEPALRDDLNYLSGSATAPLTSTDRAKADRLPRECLDAGVLLDIEAVAAFVGSAGRGEPVMFAFVAADRRSHLESLVGKEPNSARILAVRTALAEFATVFQTIRAAPDWKVTVEGEKPPMPFLDLLREAHSFLPESRIPSLWTDPKVPTFAGPEGELLAQLDQFFNGEKAKAAFPIAQFPKMYRDGRIPPIPTAIVEYRAQILEGIAAEKVILLPADDSEKARALESLNIVYDRLARFFEAVESFDAGK